MILITGASGFLGQHLLQHLSAQNKEIRALYHRTQPPAHLKNMAGVEWMCCDLLDIYEVEQAMQGVEEVYHCAGMVSFQPAHREAMLHFNPESTANLVNEALVQGIRKMVHVSSVAALGRTGDQKKEITEDAQWGESKYNSAYALSKYLAEMEVWRGIGEGLNACIINPGIILGEGSWDKGSTQLMKVVHKEFPFYTNGVTSWVDVQDVVKASVMLMESDVEAERFIISAGNYAYREIFTRMAKALDKNLPVITQVRSCREWCGGSAGCRAPSQESMLS
jgi:dihydroflavonol-4-reductase